MAIRGIGRRPDQHPEISVDLDRMDATRESAPTPADVPKSRRRSAGATGAGAGGRAPRPTSRAGQLVTPARIGIVVIHGIGDMKPGETILQWAQSLRRVVNAWAATTPGVDHGNDQTITADIDLSGGERPWVAMAIPADATHPPQTWLLTEAWWAARVVAPSLADMFRWLFPQEMLRLIRGIFSGIGSEGRWFFKAVDFVFLPLFVVPLTLLVLVVYLLLSLVQLIPNQTLKDNALVKGLNFFLVDWFGDLRVLLVDRGQAASIRRRAADAIQACLDQQCDTVVVIGHSGGTVVGYTTLSDPAYADKPVQRFITLGQALTISWRLGHVDAPATADRTADRVYAGDRLADTPASAGRTKLQWFDFWATHDPAPSGGFGGGPAAATPDQVDGSSTRVFSRMSLLEDHGAYWDNDEEFMIPVVRLLDTAPTNADPSTSRFFADGLGPQRIAKRRARVEILQASWVAVMLAGALAIPAIVLHPFASAGVSVLESTGNGVWGFLASLTAALKGLLGLVGITPIDPAIDPLVASLIGVAVMFGAFWGIGQAASGIWDAWDGRERQLALQSAPAWRPAGWIVVPLALCGAGALALLWFAGSGDWWHAVPTIALVLLAQLVRLFTPKGSVT
jgi:hypothetical protein